MHSPKCSHLSLAVTVLSNRGSFILSIQTRRLSLKANRWPAWGPRGTQEQHRKHNTGTQIPPPVTPPRVSSITEAACNCGQIITIKENRIKFLFPNASQEGQSTLHFYAAKLFSNYFVSLAVKKMQKEMHSC